MSRRTKERSFSVDLSFDIAEGEEAVWTACVYECPWPKYEDTAIYTEPAETLEDAMHLAKSALAQVFTANRTKRAG